MLKELLKNAQCDDVQGFFSSCRQAIPSSAYLCWDYRHQLQALATVFGTDQLTVRHFHPDHLKAGCVVADFCDQFGLAPPAAPAPLVNAGLSLDACRLLHAYNLSLPTRGFSRIRPI